jgi:peptidoglycan/LPS O-acetylase OafA/YrhL
MDRSRQLDSLRGCAVLLVVIHHWTELGHGIGLGNIGVQLFFVLSGFLITRILLGLRNPSAGPSLPQIFWQFQRRRAARIVPVIFLVLTVVALTGDRFARPADLPWHFLFLSNVFFFLNGGFVSSLAHFWTLAVEFQFYLLWPLFVFLVPASRLEATTLVLIVLAPLSRLALWNAGFQEFAEYNTLPFANLDSLGIGALVAQWCFVPAEQARGRRHLLGGLAALAALGVISFRMAGGLPANLEQFFFAVVFGWLVWRAWSGFSGASKHVLEWRPLAAIGTVSYGVYVYHVFAPRTAGAVLRLFDAPMSFQGPTVILAVAALVTAIAAGLSWYFFERPILQFEKSYPRQFGVARTVGRGG